MNPLEIRIIAYAISALVIFGGIGWLGYHVAQKHYEAILTSEHFAQAQALSQAQAAVIAAQNAQKNAEDKAEQETLKREQVDTDSRSAVLVSVRGLETAIHSRLLPTAVAGSGAVQASQSSSIDPQRLAGLVDRFNASLEQFIGACQSDSADRAAILSLEPQVKP